VAISVADPDPGFGALLTPGSGMGKKSGSGSGIRNPDHISKSLETIFWVKILKFFDADLGWKKNTEPGSGMEKSRIRDQGWKKVGSGIRDGKKSDPGSGKSSRIRNTGGNTCF
jgi:hypothetical protein